VSAEAFQREFSMLERLFPNPHPHIVTHITSWSQKGTHYILYPRAARNLRRHMAHHNPPSINGVNVAWFLRQLHGLASALRSIHQVQEEFHAGIQETVQQRLATALRIVHQVQEEFHAGIQETVQQRLASALRSIQQVQEELPAGIQETAQQRLTGRNNHFVYGYHQDIKPENILPFERVEGQNPVLKLSDFGAGKFHSMPKNEFDNTSQQVSQIRGTNTYYSPEYDSKKTRPSDIWALACVYLELMIWYSMPKSLKDFRHQRIEPSQTTPEWTDDLYWRWKPDKTKELRPAVIHYLGLLKNQFTKDADDIGRLLLNVLNLIKDCFKIDSKERPTAEIVSDRLDKLQQEAETLAKRVEHEVPTHSPSPSRSPSDRSDTSEDRHWRSPSPRNHTFPP